MNKEQVAELLKEVGEPVGLVTFVDGECYAELSDTAKLVEFDELFTSDQVAAAILKATKPLEDQLQAKVAELEADLEFQTNARIQDRKDAETNYKNWNAELKKQLTAEQLNNKLLREALTACVCAMQDYQAGIGITEIFDKGERLGRKALALPRDTIKESEN